MDYVYSRQERALSSQLIDKIQQPYCFCNLSKEKKPEDLDSIH